jgi:hypothetical protein
MLEIAPEGAENEALCFDLVERNLVNFKNNSKTKITTAHAYSVG